jgi:hypothetical protein
LFLVGSFSVQSQQQQQQQQQEQQDELYHAQFANVTPSFFAGRRRH